MTSLPNLPRMSSAVSNSKSWWREAVFYQIYPLSFADSDGNGLGDLEGIISKLDYLSEILGVDAIWLSPFFRSPMRDWGYDVSDHSDVDPIFGDIGSAEMLIDEAHRRGLRVIFDYLMNHTSNEHPWFVESSSSKSSPKRDWYVWADPKEDGSPPNNWVSVFSGPAWTFDEATGQYYRHTYLAHQPDLNWRNPEVVAAMLDVARFWLDRGVDGFRVDAAHQMMKDPQNRDNPPTPPDYDRPWKDMGEYDKFIHLYDLGHPDVHIAHRGFRKVLDEYPHHPVSVGEIHIFDLPEWASYYGDNFDQFHMPFNFLLMATQWDPVRIRATVESVLWNVPVGGWTNWTLGNHDEIRLATRVGEDQARLAALLLLTLRGTPFLYYGDELAMRDVEIPFESKKDPWGIRVNFLSRDGARTPMRWDGSADGGFALGKAGSHPWLPLGPDVATVNVESELGDPDSMLNLYRRILDFRRRSLALRRGSYLTHPSSNEHLLVYRRESDDETITVALNFGSAPTELEFRAGRVMISTADPQRDDEFRKKLTLAGGEGVIVAHG